MTQTDEPNDDGPVLAQMLALAERLITTDDALLQGQYAHLHARVAALIELRSMADAT